MDEGHLQSERRQTGDWEQKLQQLLHYAANETYLKPEKLCVCRGGWGFISGFLRHFISSIQTVGRCNFLSRAADHSVCVTESQSPKLSGNNRKGKRKDEDRLDGSTQEEKNETQEEVQGGKDKTLKQQSEVNRKQKLGHMVWWRRQNKNLTSSNPCMKQNKIFLQSRGVSNLQAEAAPTPSSYQTSFKLHK